MMRLYQNPHVLIVTPEVAYLPHGDDNAADNLSAKASGLADVSAAIIKTLYEQGADVHVAIPDYRTVFNECLPVYLPKSANGEMPIVPN
jgi:starch synthase/alpha-amylase